MNALFGLSYRLLKKNRDFGFSGKGAVFVHRILHRLLRKCQNQRAHFAKRCDFERERERACGTLFKFSELS